MSDLNIYPVGGYISKAVQAELCAGCDPLLSYVVRDLVMASAKGSKVVNPKFFGKDRGLSERVVVDAIDLGERQGVLAVEYSENAKGYPQMTVELTEKCTKWLKDAKAEAQARYANA